MFEKLLILFYYLKTKYFMHFSSREQLDRWQQKRLRKFLDYIIPRSPFYHSLYRKTDSRNKLTPINKAIFMENFDNLNTVGISLKEALEVAQLAEDSRNFSPTCKGYTVGLSSGTSGIRGVFLVSRLERAKWCGTILAKMLPRGLFSVTKIAFFLRADSNLYETIHSSFLKFKFFDLKEDFSLHVGSLQSFQPNVLVAPPTVLDLLSKKQQQGEISLTLEKIISVADVLYDDIKQRVQNSFHLPVHQIYQATEGLLGCSCKEGNLHLNEDLIHIEKKVLDEKNHKFIPIITDFNRTTQPIIAYELNDILTEDPTPCPCGSPMIRLKQIEGRADDILCFKDDNGKEKLIFPDFIIRLILRVCPMIGEFKVVQEGSFLHIFASISDVKRQELEAHLQSFFSENRLTVKCVFMPFSQKIPLTMKNKRVIRSISK
ncbi:MAG: hypothetical protein IKL48_02985 [Elusimicrobiaceae bacterium]|nr:hypothetical protein [Elusimicrobiaceae bacterium]